MWGLLSSIFLVKEGEQVSLVILTSCFLVVVRLGVIPDHGFFGVLENM